MRKLKSFYPKLIALATINLCVSFATYLRVYVEKKQTRSIYDITLMKHFNCTFRVRSSDHRTTYNNCYCRNNNSFAHYTLAEYKVQSTANYNGLFLNAWHFWDFRWKSFFIALEMSLCNAFNLVPIAKEVILI